MQYDAFFVCIIIQKLRGKPHWECLLTNTKTKLDLTKLDLTKLFYAA